MEPLPLNIFNAVGGEKYADIDTRLCMKEKTVEK